MGVHGEDGHRARELGAPFAHGRARPGLHAQREQHAAPRLRGSRGAAPSHRPFLPPRPCPCPRIANLPPFVVPCCPLLTGSWRMLTQERDLITLALRFAVASHCGEAIPADGGGTPVGATCSMVAAAFAVSASVAGARLRRSFKGRGGCSSGPHHPPPYHTHKGARVPRAFLLRRQRWAESKPVDEQASARWRGCI